MTEVLTGFGHSFYLKVRFMMRLLMALSLFMLALNLPAHANSPQITVEGTMFKVVTEDGQTLTSPDLVGAVLTIDTRQGPMVVRIDGVERDPKQPNAFVWLHSFSLKMASGEWVEMCNPGPDGRTQAFPLVGRQRDPDGLIEPDPEGKFELTCTGGAMGKCVRFGYFPWLGGHDLDLYNACVRMVRADYSGTGLGTTRTGMAINIYDDKNIQVADPDEDFDLEAGWTPNGAVCVRHVRVKENTSLEVLAKTVPKLKKHLGTKCTEAEARKLGAILFNRSRP